MNQPKTTPKLDLSRKVLTVQELAQYLDLHQSTVYRLVSRGEIPAFRIGSDWRFRIEEIDDWIKHASNIRTR